MRGSLRLRSFTSPKENILGFPNLLIAEEERFVSLKVCEFRNYKAIFLVDFSDIDNRSAASLYTNKLVFINKESLPFLPKGEFYWEDLIGFKVINRENCELGRVVDFIETGSKDVMRILGSKEIYIPFVWNHYILMVNDIEKVINVDWEKDW